jgi:hypothetical protein
VRWLGMLSIRALTLSRNNPLQPVSIDAICRALPFIFDFRLLYCGGYAPQ